MKFPFYTVAFYNKNSGSIISEFKVIFIFVIILFSPKKRAEVENWFFVSI